MLLPITSRFCEAAFKPDKACSKLISFSCSNRSRIGLQDLRDRGKSNLRPVGQTELNASVGLRRHADHLLGHVGRRTDALAGRGGADRVGVVAGGGLCSAV